jgi:predicted nucleic acid-binding protein
MSAKRFFDTNVLIYAFANEDRKSAIAEDLLREGGTISVQVLNEFANVSRKKLKLQWSEISARLFVVAALFDSPLPITQAIHESSVTLAAKHKIAFYDAVLVASAQSAKCTVLISEDLQHGAKFGDVTIQNPFA